MKSPTENPKDIAIVYLRLGNEAAGLQYSGIVCYALEPYIHSIWVIYRVHSIPVRSGSQKGISVEVTMCIAGALVKIVDIEVLHSLTG